MLINDGCFLTTRLTNGISLRPISSHSPVKKVLPSSNVLPKKAPAPPNIWPAIKSNVSGWKSAIPERTGLPPVKLFNVLAIVLDVSLASQYVWELGGPALPSKGLSGG